MEKAPDTYNVRAVERAMQILSAFDGEHADRGVSEIAQATGLHKATTHRIMMTLLNGGFLERARHGEKFRLGIRVVELALDAQWIHLQAAAERVAGDVVDDQALVSLKSHQYHCL